LPERGEVFFWKKWEQIVRASRFAGQGWAGQIRLGAWILVLNYSIFFLGIAECMSGGEALRAGDRSVERGAGSGERGREIFGSGSVRCAALPKPAR
jgi:hypothetical protein